MNNKFLKIVLSLVLVLMFSLGKAYSATEESDAGVIDWGGLEDPLVLKQNQTYKYSILFDNGAEIKGIDTNPYSQISEDVIVAVNINYSNTPSGLISAEVTIKTDSRVGSSHWSIVYDYDDEAYHTVPRTVIVTDASVGEASDKGIESWGSLTSPLVLSNGQTRNFNIQLTSACVNIDSIICFPAINSGDDPVTINHTVTETTIGLRAELEIIASDTNNGTEYYSIVYKDANGVTCHTTLREIQVIAEEIGELETDKGILSWGELTSPVAIGKNEGLKSYDIQFSSECNSIVGIVVLPNNRVTLNLTNQTKNYLGIYASLTIMPVSIGTSYYSIIYKDNDGNTCHTALREIQVVEEEIGGLETNKGIESWGELTSPLTIAKNDGAKTYEIQFNSECASVIEGSEVCFPSSHATIQVKNKGSNALGLLAEVTITPISAGTSYYSIVYKDTDGNTCHTTLREIQVVEEEIGELETDKGISSWGELTSPLAIAKNDGAKTYEIQFNSECASIIEGSEVCFPSSHATIQVKNKGSNALGLLAEVTITPISAGTSYYSIVYKDTDGNTCHTTLREIQVSESESDVDDSGIIQTDKGIDNWGGLLESIDIEQNSINTYRIQFNSECLSVQSLDYYVMSTNDTPIEYFRLTDSGSNYVGIWQDVEIAVNDNTGLIYWNIFYTDNNGNQCRTLQRLIQVVPSSGIEETDKGIDSLGELDASPLELDSNKRYVYRVQFNSECSSVIGINYAASSTYDPISSFELAETSGDNYIGFWNDVEIITNENSGSLRWSITYLDSADKICQTVPRIINVTGKTQNDKIIISDDAVESFGGLTEGLSLTGKSNSVYDFEIQFNEKCSEVGDIIYVASSVENPIQTFRVKSIEENAIGYLAKIELVLSNVSGSVSWWITYENINGNSCRTVQRTITIEHKTVEQGGGGCNSFLIFPALFALAILKFRKS